jgi:hypothetical protein
MLLQDLFEAKQYDAAFGFGRFNPSHAGHIAVWKTVQSASSNWFIGTNPNTHDIKNPLPFPIKKAWMETIYPEIKGHILPEVSILTTAAFIFKKLKNNEKAKIAYITDAEDWNWSGKLLMKENGRKDGNHDYFKFARIDHIASPRVSSATALRDAAMKNDEYAFYAASKTDPKLKVKGMNYFQTVRKYLLGFSK